MIRLRSLVFQVEEPVRRIRTATVYDGMHLKDENRISVNDIPRRTYKCLLYPLHQFSCGAGKSESLKIFQSPVAFP